MPLGFYLFHRPPPWMSYLLLVWLQPQNGCLHAMPMGITDPCSPAPKLLDCNFLCAHFPWKYKHHVGAHISYWDLVRVQQKCIKSNTGIQADRRTATTGHNTWNYCAIIISWIGVGNFQKEPDKRQFGWGLKKQQLIPPCHLECA